MTEGDLKPSEIVPSAPTGTVEAKDVTPTVVDKEGEEVVVNGHLFTPIVLGAKAGEPAKLIRLSQRERRFLGRLLATGNLELACSEINLNFKGAARFLKRPNIRQYLDEKYREAALSKDTTLENNIAWLRKVRDGSEEPDKIQMEAAKTIARIHKPASVGTKINVQQNNINAAASVPNPYSGMDLSTIITETQEALDVGQGRRGTQT